MSPVSKHGLDTFGNENEREPAQLEETIRMYQRATETAQLTVWRYDIPNRRITMSETAKNTTDYETLGIPKIIENVPESLIPFMDEGSVDAFLEMYRQVDEGAPVASCEIWSKPAPGYEPHCDRLSYATVLDENGKPIVAYGFGVDITSRKSAERRLQKEHDELESLRQTLLAASSFNATKDKPTILNGLNASIKTEPYSDWVYQEAIALDPRIADQNPETLATLLSSAEQVIDPELRHEFIMMCSHPGILDMFNAGKRGKTLEYQRNMPDGPKWVSTQLVLLPDPKTRDVQAFFYTRDIDNDKRNERIVDLITSEDLDYIGLIHTASQTFELIKQGNDDALPFGSSIDQETSNIDIQRPDGSPKTSSTFWEALEQNTVIDALDKNGSHLVSFETAEGTSHRHKQVLYRWLDEPGGDILVTQRDITESFEREQQRIRQETLIDAYEHDPLTGMYSRDAAIMHIKATVSEDSTYTMIVIIIDNLRFIRDSYGYAIGDAVIRAEAQRLSKYFEAREEDCTIAHTGGGRFLVFIPQCLICNDAETELRAIERVARGKITLDAVETNTRKGITIWPHTSIGAASSDEVSGPSEIWHKAGLAGDSARDDAEHIRFYTDELSIDAKRRREVLAALTHAMDEETLVMVYQPKIDVQHNCITGFEALVRMKNDAALPGEFIPVAEEAGFISRIGRITTRLVIEQLAAWRDTGKEPLPVSINYSSKQLGDREYLAFLLALLQEHKLPTSLVEIEITESLLLRPSQTARHFFARVKEAGIRMLMDDFGSGYSSLSYLSYVPAEIIKLDKSIIDTYLVPAKGADCEGNEFIRDIILLMHDLGKTVTAEGVEHAWQAEILHNCGCDVIQGFFFARPMQPNAAIEFSV